MAKNLKEHVIATLKSVMRPIIMLFLRNGVTYKEFAFMCKSIFVEAAAEDYGIRGRPTNVSRISLLTGIDRKEVKRLKDLLQDNRAAQEAQTFQDKITRLLTAWHVDAEFSDESGSARLLPAEGDTGSFQSLARRFGGDISWQTLLKELIRVGVAEHSGDFVKASARYFFPAQKDPQALLRAGAVISELGETLFYNLYVADDEKNKCHFERRASNNLVDVKHKESFHAFLDIEGQAFLERVDAWLSEHEYQGPIGDPLSESAPQTIRLGVSVFGIDKPTSEVEKQQ